ncbi:MAG: hypothetical protein ACRD0K_19405 [Egibacteraceae bacterium]
MASPGEARALLELARALKEGIETLDDPERPALELRLKQLRDLLESILRRAEAERARMLAGVGAPPRFERLR